MTTRRLTRPELRVMEVLWHRGPSSVREVHEALEGRLRPAYTTVQTVMSRMETKGAIRRARKVGNAYVFEAVLARDAAHQRFLDDLLAVFGGRAQPVMMHLVETGQLTLDDLREAERTLKRLTKKEGKR